MQELEKTFTKIELVHLMLGPVDKNQECYSCNILLLRPVKLIVLLAAMSDHWYLSVIN